VFLRKEVKVESPLESDVEEAHLSSNPTEAVLARLERATEYFRREIHLVLRARGMTSTQYNVLRTLYNAEPGGITCSELGSRLTGTDPDITRLLDRLAKQRLVLRRRDQRDRRAVLTEITVEGRELVESVIPSLDSRLRDLFDHMAPARVQLLTDLLDEAITTERQQDRAPQSSPKAKAG
jgi:DNA-binding MarR family transcriptional regulator